MNLAEYLEAHTSRPHLSNREGWLTELAQQIHPTFRGLQLAPYRLTCGWPSKMALGRRVRRLGECHSPLTSSGKLHEIFISPLLEDSAEVAGTVCHELAHVAAGVDAGHGPVYRRVCKHVGLTRGKPTVAMPGRVLQDKILKIVEALGEYPHRAIVPVLRPCKPPAAVTLCCPRCGCAVRITLSWLEKSGAPACGCGAPMEVKGT